MSVQMRIPLKGLSVTSAGGNTVWMSPDRDIAHIFPQYVSLALQMIEKHPEAQFMRVYWGNDGTDEDLQQIVLFFRTFMSEKGTTAERLKAAKFDTLKFEVKQVAAYALMMVVLSAYVKGSQDATYGAEDPSNPGEPTITVELAQPRNWVFRKLRMGLLKVISWL